MVKEDNTGPDWIQERLTRTHLGTFAVMASSSLLHEYKRYCPNRLGLVA